MRKKQINAFLPQTVRSQFIVSDVIGQQPNPRMPPPPPQKSVGHQFLTNAYFDASCQPNRPLSRQSGSRFKTKKGPLVQNTEARSPYSENAYVQSRPNESRGKGPRAIIPRHRMASRWRQTNPDIVSNLQTVHVTKSVRLPRRTSSRSFGSAVGSPHAGETTIPKHRKSPSPVSMGIADTNCVLGDIQGSTLGQQCQLLAFFTSSADQPKAVALNMATCLIHSISSRIQAWYRGTLYRRWKFVQEWRNWAAVVIQRAWNGSELRDMCDNDGLWRRSHGRNRPFVSSDDGTEYCYRVMHSAPAVVIGTGSNRVTICACEEGQMCDACT
jgi:hypothetical protein